jgi:branched-chain amino acid transport system substrate-binding protein
MAKHREIEDLAGNPISSSRRKVIVGAAAGAVALALGGPRAFAADPEKVLRIGFISPRSGPLAGFGQGDPYVLSLARKALANGLTLGGTTYKVEILDRDTQSDPSRASQLANDLINNHNVDLMLSTSTPEVTNPVADACEAAGVPSLSTTVPWESFYFGRGGKPGKPSPFKWSYVFCFGTNMFATTYLSTWGQLDTNKRVAVMYPNDADGMAIREHLVPLLEKGGYTIVDPGPYQDGTTDYSTQIALFKRERCEIFNTAPIPPDFASFWRQAAQQGFARQVKIVEPAKTGIFPAQVNPLGPLAYNLSGAAYWHKVFPYKSTLTGVSGMQLADGYEASTGRQWEQQLGASMALLDAGFAALKASRDPKSKSTVREALAKLDTTTMVGRINFNTGPFPNVSITPLVGAQWIKAPAGSKFQFDYVTVEHAADPNVPIQAKLQPFHL